MSAWQMALKKIEGIQQYEEVFKHVLADILLEISFPTRERAANRKKDLEIAETIVLIIGTERGLCGRFNRVLAENAISWIKDQNFPSYQIWVLGTRMVGALKRMNVEINWRKPLPSGEGLTFQHAYLTVQNWLASYESRNFNQLVILFNQIGRGGQYTFTWKQLLPFEIDHPDPGKRKVEKKWPPPIIETDPKGIYLQIIDQHIASEFFRILLQSTAAEHAFRFRLMEDAGDNAQEIMKELKMIINTERKRKITQEMQELASGSGLLEN